MLLAAANVDSESLEVVIATLDDERKKNVRETQQTLTRFTTSITQRGSANLMAMDEAEWQRLVDEAEAGR